MPLQGTGEEWRAMDDTTGLYKPDDARIAAAKQSIEKIRKRDVELRLVGTDGKPLADMPVEIVQTRSSFPWGDQLWGLDRLYRFGQADTDKGKYMKRMHAGLLNAANALCYWTERDKNDGPKSEDIQGDPQYDGFAYCVDWINSEQMIAKGHPLFWSIQKCVPEWVKRYDYDTQMKFAEVRVRNLVARFRGKVKIWDAVNEPMWEPAFKNLPQRNWPHIDPIPEIADYIQQVLTWCRDEDPDATFLVNDYGMEANKGDDKPKIGNDGSQVTAASQRKRYLALMRELQQRGTPPDAIGLQAHTGGWLSHDVQAAVYDEMATAGIPLHITEFWAHTRHLRQKGIPEEQISHVQAEYVTNYMTVAFGHPAIGGFFFWGMMGDAVKWGEHSSHEPTVLYERMAKLLREEWMTRLTLRTDSQGKVRFRGFLGDYSARYALSPKATRGAKFSVAPEDAMPKTMTLSRAT